MVSESLLRSLNAAFNDAVSNRNRIQMEVNDSQSRVVDAQTNLERAETQETTASQRNQQKIDEARELTDYYNGLADQSGLNAIQQKLTQLSVQQQETHRQLLAARTIRQQRHQELEDAKIAHAVARQNLERAIKEWQRMSEQLEQARNEK